jgi:hypothetical protein
MLRSREPYRFAPGRFQPKGWQRQMFGRGWHERASGEVNGFDPQVRNLVAAPDGMSDSLADRRSL